MLQKQGKIQQIAKIESYKKQYSPLFSERITYTTYKNTPKLQ